MKKIVVGIILLLFTSYNNLHLQEIPDCFCIPITNQAYEYNYDSVAIDTCDILFPFLDCDQLVNDVLMLDYIHDHYLIFARKYWILEFEFKAFNLPLAPPDTIIEITWRDIDTNFTEVINAFKTIENKFGDFIFRKRHPDRDNQKFLMFFKNYIREYSFRKEISKIDKLVCEFISDFYILIGGVDNNFDDSYCDLDLFYNTASSQLELKFNRVYRESRNIDIYSVLGQLVLSQNVQDITENKKVMIDTKTLTPGVYFLKYNQCVKKFIVWG